MTFRQWCVLLALAAVVGYGIRAFELFQLDVPVFSATVLVGALVASRVFRIIDQYTTFESFKAARAAMAEADGKPIDEDDDEWWRCAECGVNEVMEEEYLCSTCLDR